MIHWIALNMVEGIKPTHTAALLRQFKDARAIFKQTELDLMAVPEIKQDLASRIAQFDLSAAEAELSKAQQNDTRVICLTDPEYPPLLRKIFDPPLCLYVRGELAPDDLTIALVGSRKATPYGLNVAQFLATDLTKFANAVIVSGLARGVDARAHQAAMNAGGRTYAVMGSGLDVMYPSEHRQLAEKIVRQGALISEFPFGTAPNRENFPVRNRIISGLSYAVIVVEGSQKSGSLITARTAAEQGREVMAVPGSIFNESSQGCNTLIKDGAAVIRNWQDVVAELPEEAAAKIVSRTDDKSVEEEMSQVEKSIIGSLSFEEPRHVDQIAGATGIHPQDLLGLLVNLELKDYITQMPGKHFIRRK